MDVIRCVRELNLYSRHEHRMWVRDEHPATAHIFEQAPNLGDATARAYLLEWCDAIIYEYVDHTYGLDEPSKPAAFRNIVVHGQNMDLHGNPHNGKFWTWPCPDPRMPTIDAMKRFKLFSAPHVGAKDFLPQPFRWLPDLHPLDGLYSPDWSDRPPCVSYIKQADMWSTMNFPKHMRCTQTPHSEVLRKRRSEATAVIDNIEDGHWGFAGTEAASMGLPAIVYIHEKTKQSLEELMDGGPTPFIEVGESPAEAAAAAIANSNPSLPHRQYIRTLMQTYFNPKRLVEKYWDPFVDELVS